MSVNIAMGHVARNERNQLPTVLITGANIGFGRALLDVYIKSGWTVFPLVRRQEDAEALVATYHSACFTIVADVTSENAGETITGIRAWISRMAGAASAVIKVQDSRASPLGSRQLSQRPANAKAPVSGSAM